MKLGHKKPRPRGVFTQRFAELNRNKPTGAENKFNEILEKIDNGVLKDKFIFQWAFKGKWILDFYFYENRFGIEIDGSYHNIYRQKEVDNKKTKACQDFNITIIRFTNKEVFGNREKLIKKFWDGYNKASKNYEQYLQSSKRKSQTAQKDSLPVDDKYSRFYQHNFNENHIKTDRPLPTTNNVKLSINHPFVINMRKAEQIEKSVGKITAEVIELRTWAKGKYPKLFEEYLSAKAKRQKEKEEEPRRQIEENRTTGKIRRYSILKQRFTKPGFGKGPKDL
ncbi:MAG: DUF559 domain-containing protein [Patescibacteria group bacterium]